MQFKKDFSGRDFLSLYDYSKNDLSYFMDLADFLKAEKKAGRPIDYLRGKTLGMIFEKSSTRTRVSFETGIYYLGGTGLFLSSQDIQLGRGEPLCDTARVMTRYVDGLMIRTFAHENVEELAKYADIPVINGLTDLLHPCQVLADLLTIRQHKGTLSGLKMVFLGDGSSNMANSLMLGAAKMGLDIVIASADGYSPSPNIYQLALSCAAESGAKIELTADPFAAVKSADVLYTDVWASMGQEEEQQKRQRDLSPFQINQTILAAAKKDAVVMHCLPAKRGQEITDEVMESPQSIVFDQAENRLWAQMAVMASLMCDK